MIILGLDPGSTRTGYAYLRVAMDRHAMLVTYASKGDLDNAQLAGLVVTTGYDVLAIERPEGIAYGPKGAGIVPHLISASNAAGLAKGAFLGKAAMARNTATLCEYSAPVWRQAVCGKANASDAVVKNAILTLVRGWPKVSNAHERDAAGVALFAARQVVPGLWARRVG